MKTVGDRVQAVVDRVHAGSVSAAAKALEMPHSSLGKILSGEVASPRGQTFKKFVDLYGGSFDWWLTGEGQAPPVLSESTWNFLPQAELLRWDLLRRRLGASPQVSAALAGLNTPILRAANLAMPELDVSRKRLDEYRAAVREAIRMNTLGWIAWLELMISTLGLEGTRKKLEKHVVELERGFLRPTNVAGAKRN